MTTVNSKKLDALRMYLSVQINRRDEDARISVAVRTKIWGHLRRELGIASSHRAAGTSCLGDLNLVRRLRSGDAAAFDQLFEKYGARHLNFALRWLQKPDAEDAVQMAWLDFVRKREELPDQVNSLGAYLHGFVRIAVLRVRRKAVLAEPLPDSLPAIECDELPFNLDDTERLKDAMGGLDPLSQEVILLSLAGKKPSSIAEELFLDLGHFRVLKHRAVKQLRVLLEAE